MTRKLTRLLLCSGVLCVSSIQEVSANGIYREGLSPRSAALGGVSVSLLQDPVSSMGSNPATLSYVGDVQLQVGLTGYYVDGKFESASGSSGDLKNRVGLAPDIAAAYRLENHPITIGVGVVTEAALSAHWTYVDPPGGAGGVSYGSQKHFSEIIAIRGNLGLSYQVNEKFAIGAALGGVYNQNKLEAPYVFQDSSLPVAGLKTLLDLDTDGSGMTGNIGLVYQPHRRVTLGLSYTSETKVTSEGTAYGNADVQLAAIGLGTAQPDFVYDAEVINYFPQRISGGVALQAHEKLLLNFQVDWINWSDSFDKLRIRLRNGSNADINGVIGSTGFDDAVPLEWEDRFVYRTGVEYSPVDYLQLRAGYSYGKSPVPSGTLTPMTAAILEHTIGVGVGYQFNTWQFDLGYQYGLPNSQSVGQSDLSSGEYDDSKVEVEMHSLGFAASFRF